MRFFNKRDIKSYMSREPIVVLLSPITKSTSEEKQFISTTKDNTADALFSRGPSDYMPYGYSDKEEAVALCMRRFKSGKKAHYIEDRYRFWGSLIRDSDIDIQYKEKEDIFIEKYDLICNKYEEIVSENLGNALRAEISRFLSKYYHENSVRQKKLKISDKKHEAAWEQVSIQCNIVGYGSGLLGIEIDSIFELAITCLFDLGMLEQAIDFAIPKAVSSIFSAHDIANLLVEVFFPTWIAECFDQYMDIYQEESTRNLTKQEAIAAGSKILISSKRFQVILLILLLSYWGKSIGLEYLKQDKTALKESYYYLKERIDYEVLRRKMAEKHLLEIERTIEDSVEKTVSKMLTKDYMKRIYHSEDTAYNNSVEIRFALTKMGSEFKQAISEEKINDKTSIVKEFIIPAAELTSKFLSITEPYIKLSKKSTIDIATRFLEEFAGSVGKTAPEVLSEVFKVWLREKKDVAAINQNECIVYFNHGSSEITEHGKRTLKDLRDHLVQKNSRITLIGAADRSGSDKINDDLANARMKVVKDLLVDSGIDSGLITGFIKIEENAPVYTKNGVKEPENRSVRVLY